MKVVKNSGRLWFQGTVSIADGGTSATTVAQALVNLGYIPSSSLGQPNGTVPLVGGVIPKEYLGLSDTGPVAVMGNTRMMVGGQRTLSITNFDSFGTYNITAKYGTVGTLSVAGATAGDFLYTAPATKPVEGKDTITINGIAYDVEILGSNIAKPSIVSPVENYGGGVGSIGTITSSAYSAGSTTIVDSITIGGTGSFATPSGTEKIRVVNRSQVSVTVSQAGTTKTIPANSELEWTGTGTWLYSVIAGRVLVEFLKGTNSHASSDWQIATDLAFSNVLYQTNSDTANKVSWPNPVTTSGVYYIRVRHRDATGTVSSWSEARRIAPTATVQTRQTSWATSWTSSWYTNWVTTLSGSRNTSSQTSVTTNYSTIISQWGTLYQTNRVTAKGVSYNTSISTLISPAGNPHYTFWLTAASEPSYYQTNWLTNGLYTSQQTSAWIVGEGRKQTAVQTASPAVYNNTVWATSWNTNVTTSYLTTYNTVGSQAYGTSHITTYLAGHATAYITQANTGVNTSTQVERQTSLTTYF